MKKPYLYRANNRHYESGTQKTGKVAATRRWLGLAAALVATLFNCAAPAQTIQLISAPAKFYVDDKAGNGILYNYAAYTVSNNTAITLPSVYVAITNIASTNRILLSSGDSGARALGSLAPGEVKMAAFNMKGPSFSGNSDTLIDLTNENHTIQVLNGPPGVGSVLVSSNYSYTNIIYVTEALANKVTLITNLNPYAVLGAEVILVIAGDTGTIGGQNSVFFSPAVLNSWRPDCYELNGTVTRFTENPTYTNRMYFDPSVSGFTNFSGQSYSNVFFFRAVKPTGTNIAISPFAFIDSGSGTKHTAESSLASSGGSNVVYSATNYVSIVDQTVTPNSLFAPGGTVTYLITFTNYSSGNSNITLDEIVDTLPGSPANVTYIPGSATFNSLPLADPTIVGQALHWAMPFGIAANGISVLSFQATAPAPAGDYTNSVIALIGPSQIDSTIDTTDNSPSSSVFTIVPVSDVAIGKTGPASVVAAANFDYTIVVTNLGPSPVTELSVTDSLPANVAFVSASSGGFFSGGQVIWTNLPTIASNAVATLTVTVTSPSEPASLTNTASGSSPILDPNPTNNAAPPVFTSVTASADVSASKSGPATISAGANFDYTITVSNAGPSTATSLSVTDDLPAGVTFFGASAGGVLSGAQVLWPNLGSLAAGSTTNLILTVTAPVSGAGLTNTVSVGSPVSDPNPTNNTSTPVTTIVTPSADVIVSKSAPANLNLGASFAYTISVTNLGPSAAASLSVTDMLPASVTFVSASGGGVLNGGQVLWTNFNLAAGSSTNFTLNVTAPGVTSALTNIASGGGSTSDPNPTNNTSGPVISTVGASADLSVSKSSPASVNAGQNFNYTITVANLGPTLASSVTVTDNLPASVTFVSASAGGVLEGSQVVWTDLGVLAANSSTNLILTVTAPADGGSLTNTVSVGSPTPDPTPTNNSSAPVLTTITPVADLMLTKTGPATNPLPGANFDYTITVTNLGPSAAVSVTATDALPVNVTFVSASGGGMLSGANVLWTNLGSLPASASTNLTLTVTAPLSGGVTNTASVSSPTTDPNPTNNVTPPVTTAVSNVPPVTVNDTFSVPEDTLLDIPAAGVLTNDSDANGDAFTALLVTTTANGALTLNPDGSFSYIPNLNYNGADSFTYQATDGTGTSGVATVTINVTPVNDAPTANAQGVTTPEDTPKAITLTGSDIEASTLTFAVVNAPTNGTISGLNPNTGALTYTPNTNFNGFDAFTFVVNDGTTNSQPALVSITVTPVNDPPVANGQNVSTPEDTAKAITLIGSDVEGSTLTFAIVNNPTNGTISGFNPNTGALIYMPNTNFNGSDALSFVVNDGTTNSQPALVSITVTPVNDAPVANNDAYSLIKNTTLVIPAAGILTNDTDVDGDSLTVVPGSGAAHGSLVLGVSGGFTYTPVSNYAGSDSFTYRASDGTSNSAPATVTLTILATNTPPTANNDTYSTPEDTALTIPAAGILTNDVDVDGDALTALLVANVTHGSLSLNANGSFTYSPDTNYNGSDGFTYRDYDGQATGNVATVTINITPVNDAPIALNDVTNTLEDVSVTVQVLANDSDPDGTSLTITGTSTTNGTAVVSGTNVVFTPDTNFNGTAVFSYTISDGTNTATANVTVTVAAVNDPPVANNDAFSTFKNITLIIPAAGVLTNDTDAEGDALTALLGVGPSHGSLILNVNGGFTYTPVSNYVGGDSFTYRALDASSTSSVATVTLTILATNTPPTADGQSVSTLQNTPKAITLTGSDPDGDLLTFNIATSPANGTLTGLNPNTGAVTYTPNPGFGGSDSFTFRANDGTTDSAPATVNITVTAQADLAVFKSGSTNGGAGTNLTFAIIATNLGPSTASNVVVFDQLPASYTFVNSVPAPASVSNNLVTWPAFNLAAFGSSSFSLTVLPAAGGVFTNVAYGTNSTPDPDPTNNNGSSTNSLVTTFVLPLADVAVLKMGNATVVAGGSLTYTITATNQGPLTATNVVITDLLPAGAAFQSASGSYTLSNSVVTWAGSNLASGESVSYTLTVTAPLSGNLTNVAASTSSTPDPDPTNNNGSSTNSRVSTVVAPLADVAVLKRGATNVVPGTQFTYTITVTNLGPSASEDIVVTDVLPTNLTFVSASSGGTFSNNVVTWSAIGLLSAGSAIDFTLTVAAPLSGSISNAALGASLVTPDPNPTNNSGGGPGTHVNTTVTPFGVLQAANSLNPQTGLYEQRVTVTNTGETTATAFRVLVGDIRSTNGVPRTNVFLYNATGTNGDSRPYVQYDSALAPGSNVTLILEFYVPDRKPFTNSLEVIAVLPSGVGTNAGPGVMIDQYFWDYRFTPARFVIEWTSVPGKSYTILYSDDSPDGPWFVVTPTVTANANRVQWYDDGPPKTVSAPASSESRNYRVITNP